MYADDVVNNGIGLVTGTATATQFPNRSVSMFRIKASPGNSEIVYIGTSASDMWPLSASDDTGWFLSDNMSDFWYKGGTGTVNKLHYWGQ